MNNIRLIMPRHKWSQETKENQQREKEHPGNGRSIANEAIKDNAPLAATLLHQFRRQFQKRFKFLLHRYGADLIWYIHRDLLFLTPLGVADTWINNTIQDISYQIEQNHKDTAHYKYGQQHRIITSRQRVKKERTHARPVKDSFRNSRATSYCAEIYRDNSDQRDSRITEGVSNQQRCRTYPFRARCSYIVLLHHIDHTGTHKAAPTSNEKRGERKHGQDEM